MTSAPLLEAAASTRTEADVRNARQASSYRAPLEMPLPSPAINVCPCCKRHPAMEDGFHGQIVIYCDNDECTSREMQAMGKTIKEAAAKWNDLEVPA